MLMSAAVLPRRRIEAHQDLLQSRPQQATKQQSKLMQAVSKIVKTQRGAASGHQPQIRKGSGRKWGVLHKASITLRFSTCYLSTLSVKNYRETGLLCYCSHAPRYCSAQLRVKIGSTACLCTDPLCHSISLAGQSAVIIKLGWGAGDSLMQHVCEVSAKAVHHHLCEVLADHGQRVTKDATAEPLQSSQLCYVRIGRIARTPLSSHRCTDAVPRERRQRRLTSARSAAEIQSQSFSTTLRLLRILARHLNQGH